jgi:hypothetical protein
MGLLREVMLRNVSDIALSTAMRFAWGIAN